MTRADYSRRYAEKNPDKMREWSAAWYATDKGKERMRKYRADRRKRDPEFRLKENLRTMVRRFCKTALSESSIKNIGCTVDEFRTHLTSQFTEGMTWENWGRGVGKWNIDHIKPLTAFDLNDARQRRQSCHYLNLQPLWFEDNLKKSDIYQYNEDHERLLDSIA